VGADGDELKISSTDYKEDLQIFINPHFGGMCNPIWHYEVKANKQNRKSLK